MPFSPSVFAVDQEMSPSESRGMRHELGGNGQAGAPSAGDRFAQPGCVPVNDDGGEQVEACHALVLALRAVVADLPLALDAQGVLPGAMGLPC